MAAAPAAVGVSAMFMESSCLRVPTKKNNCIRHKIKPRGKRKSGPKLDIQRIRSGGFDSNPILCLFDDSRSFRVLS